MDCEQALLLISAHIDREIPADPRAALDAHLRDCASCRATLDAFRLQDEELRQTFHERRRAAAAVAGGVHAELPGVVPLAVKPAPRATPRHPSRRVLASVAVSASLGIVALVSLYLASKPEGRREPPPDGQDAAAPDWLRPQPRPATPRVEPLAVGHTLQTRSGERRRTTLPDGTVLYLNQNTTVKLDDNRELTLARGEVYAEVAPRPQTGSPFVIQTAARKVTALGTKLAVRAEGQKAGVLVTQGQVEVSAPSMLLLAGQQLAPDGSAPEPAPRVTHVLDWTRELMAHAESPLVPDSKYAGGALIAVDPSGQEAKLSLRKYHIDVHMEDGFARTTIDQTYFNHETQRLEGTFYFPLPADASLSRLAMYVDGNLMEGGMVERNYGRAVYEEIVHSQRDPALLEWVDGSTFKMRVFPLEGRQEKRIVLSYTQKLPALYGQTQYRFPAGHSLEVVRDWSFHARVKHGAQWQWSCDSHELKAKMEGGDLLLDARAQMIKADRDIQLSLIDPRPTKDDVARFSSFEHEGARYLMLRYRPALPSVPKLQVPSSKLQAPRNWVFLFESSGDRDPLLARVQIDIIQTLLRHIEHGDTFAVLTAGTRVQAFAPSPQPATTENIQAAIEFLERTHLVGALDLSAALAVADTFLQTSPDSYLVHVGSGIAALGERREDVLAKSILKGARYVGVGVGKRWSRGLMKAAAERTGGYFTQINPDEPVAWRAFDLFAALNTPRLLDAMVTDGAGRARFLAMSSSLCQGEELCAITRVEAGEPMPESVIVGGMLDGQVFRVTLPVQDVAGDAGYLPRTWAKLEIDRLLAEDAGKHRDQIIALSKAMYVMTPYTSLLVLESEAMYEQFKVDRGRKDHWAMYPCPPKIPVVYEPDPLQAADPRGAPESDKPRASQVLQTVLVRVPPRMLTWPGQNDPFGGQPVLSALQMYSQARDAMKGRPEGWKSRSLSRDRFLSVTDGELLNLTYDIDPNVPVGNDLPRLDALSVRDPEAPGRRRLAEFYGYAGRARIDRDRDGLDSLHEASVFFAHSPAPVGGVAFDFAETLGRGVETTWGERAGRLSFISSDDGKRLAVAGMDGYVRLWDEDPSGDVKNLGDLGVNRYGLVAPLAGKYNLNLIDDSGSMLALFTDGTSNQLNFSPPALALRVKGTSRIHTRWHKSMDTNKASLVPRLYGRPSFHSDARLFSDLVAYAPGLNTTQADIQAVLEAEAEPNFRMSPGRIDPAARELVEKARAGGWQKLTLPGNKDVPDFALLFDGSGRYAYEYTLPLGLREQVVCDGTTLLHLYPELGVGARRGVSRFHRAALTGLLPWLLPPAEDLARGADVERVGERTVALSPRGAAAARDDEGKPLPYLRVELVFAADGRLAERRLVEMPGAKPHLCETYDAGTVKVLDADGKELATRKRTIAAAEAPELKPDTAKLVVLPLPLRTADHVYPAYSLAAQKSLHEGENLCLDFLEPAEALELFAAEFAGQRGGRAREIYRRCFHERGDRRLGFCTLLAACGVPVGADAELLPVLREHDDNPLAAYLALEHTWWYRSAQRRWSLDWGQGIGPRDGFLTRLSAFRDRWLRWQDGPARESRAEQERALGFIRANQSSALGLGLLTLVQERAGSDERLHRDLAEAWRLLDNGSGLAYTPNYEHARNLFNGGRRAEARAHFSKLYDKALEKKLLPPIDTAFRDALQGDGEEENLWAPLMRRAAATFIKEKDRPAVVTLAWQCWQLGDQPLAANLLQTALDGVDEDQRLTTRLTAVVFLRQTNQLAPADDLMRQVLREEAAAVKVGAEDERARRLRLAQLWRLAGQVAEQRGLTARSITCLEEALAIEYRWGPSVVNLQEVRNDYGKLLDHYQMLAGAVGTLKLEAPADLLKRTVRAADQWRALDRESAAPSERAAGILRGLGARELAWDYMTTPLVHRPSESDPWLRLASSLRREGDLDLADQAYRAAFDAEPTNAQVLWDRAQNLQQAGKTAEAQQVLRQIVDTKWQPRFGWVKDQARWRLQGQ